MLHLFTALPIFLQAIILLGWGVLCLMVIRFIRLFVRGLWIYHRHGEEAWQKNLFNECDKVMKRHGLIKK